MKSYNEGFISPSNSTLLEQSQRPFLVYLTHEEQAQASVPGHPCLRTLEGWKAESKDLSLVRAL